MNSINGSSSIIIGTNLPTEQLKTIGYSPLTAALFASNQLIFERIERTRADQNVKLLTWPSQVNSETEEEKSVEEDIEEVVNDLGLEVDEPTDALDIRPAPRNESLLYVSDQFRAEHPELTAKIEKLQLQFIELAGEVVKTPVKFVINGEKLTSEQAKNLFVNWMAWKVKHSNLTNNALHFSLGWLESIQKLTPQELLAQIKTDLSSIPTGDTIWNQWKVFGTMHKVYDFAVVEPEMCVVATDILERIIATMEGCKEKAKVVEDFHTACITNQNLSMEFVVTGLLLFKSDSGEVRKLLQKVGHNESLIFNVFSCATNFFNLIEKDQETTDAAEMVNRQIIISASQRPELTQEVLVKLNKVIERDPKVAEIVNTTVQDVNTMILEKPDMVNAAVKVFPILINHPLLLKLVVKTGKAAVILIETNNRAQKVRDQFGLHEDSLGVSFDPSPLGDNPKIFDENALEVAKVVIESADLISQGFDPENPIYISHETKEKSRFELIRDQAKEVIQASWLKGEKSLKEEKKQAPVALANNFGIELANALFNGALVVRNGKLSEVTVKDVTISAGKVVLNSALATVHFSAKKVAFDVVQGAVIFGLEKAAPSATKYVPGMQTVSSIYSLGKSALFSKSKEELVRNVALTTRGIVLTALAAKIALQAGNSMGGEDRPITMAILGGIITVSLLKAVDHTVPPGFFLDKVLPK